MEKVSKKQIYIFILFLAIILAFSGCGTKNTPSPADNGQNNNVATSTPAADNNKNENIASSTDEIDTSDWKVYRNEEYGYIIKYPKNWVVFDNNPYIPIHSSVQFNHSVSKTEGAAFRINIPEYGHGAESYEIISVESFQLSGIEAQKILRKKSEQLNTEMGNENIIYMSFHDKKFNYESGIEFIYSDVNQKYYKDVFNKMLDSLQFTN